jgi:protein TonB
VVPFARAKRERTAPAIVLAPDDRPASRLPSRDHARLLGFVAGSLLLHASLYLLLDRPAPPLASIGLEAMTVELVLGANTPAGLSPQASEFEGQPSAPPADAPPTTAEPEKATPEPEPTAEPSRTELAVAPPQSQPAVAESPPNAEAEPSPMTAPAEPAPSPADQDPPAASTAPAPTPVPPEPPREVAHEPATPPAPAVEKPKPPARQERAKERPTTHAAKPRERAAGGRTAALSVGSSGIGRGRSDAESNYPGLVAAHLARHKRFPADARAKGEQGVATVRFTLDGTGRVTSVALQQPSGIASLDRETQDVVRRASPFPPPPGGRPMSFTIPVRFSLR